MNNAENIARLTDCVTPEIDPPTAGSERSILDAQTILDGAYNELVQSGTVEAGKIATPEQGGILGQPEDGSRPVMRTESKGLCTTPFFPSFFIWPFFYSRARCPMDFRKN